MANRTTIAPRFGYCRLPRKPSAAFLAAKSISTPGSFTGVAGRNGGTWEFLLVVVGDLEAVRAVKVHRDQLISALPKRACLHRAMNTIWALEATRLCAVQPHPIAPTSKSEAAINPKRAPAMDHKDTSGGLMDFLFVSYYVSGVCRMRVLSKKREDRMRWQAKLLVGFVVAVVAVSVQAQERKFLVSPTQVVAIRAGRLFDAKSGNMLNNQVVLIKGDRIADVGAAVQVPPEARVIDLAAVTVMPGMIDAHVHVNTGGETAAQRAFIAAANAQIDLDAALTTV